MRGLPEGCVEAGGRVVVVVVLAVVEVAEVVVWAAAIAEHSTKLTTTREKRIFQCLTL
jgi:hypothetical protein